jgi:hypothetical protein
LRRARHRRPGAEFHGSWKIYGFVGWGVLLGGIAAGYFCAKLGLKRALPWLLLALAMPMFSYVF